MDEQKLLESLISKDFTHAEVVELASHVYANRLRFQGWKDILKLCAGWRRLYAERDELRIEVERLHGELQAIRERETRMGEAFAALEQMNQQEKADCLETAEYLDRRESERG